MRVFGGRKFIQSFFQIWKKIGIEKIAITKKWFFVTRKYNNLQKNADSIFLFLTFMIFRIIKEQLSGKFTSNFINWQKQICVYVKSTKKTITIKIVVFHICLRRIRVIRILIISLNFVSGIWAFPAISGKIVSRFIDRLIV